MICAERNVEDMFDASLLAQLCHPALGKKQLCSIIYGAKRLSMSGNRVT